MEENSQFDYNRLNNCVSAPDSNLIDTKIEVDILPMEQEQEQDDDTILLIVGDDGLQIKEEKEIVGDEELQIKEEIVDTNNTSEDGMEVKKEEMYLISFENPNESEFIENEELMPVSKVDPLDESSQGNTNEEPRKMLLKPGQRKSFVKELKRQHPELAKNETKLITKLVDIMRSVQPPPPPPDYYIMNGILFECTICSALRGSMPAASRHYQDAHGPRYLFCYACGVDFRCRSNLYGHEKRCAAPDKDVVLRARAVMLGNKGKTRPYLGLAKTLNIRSPCLKPIIINQFACESCPAVFTSKRWLESHQLLHQGVRPYKCEECDRAYTSRGTLTRHVKRNHRDEQYICDHCDRVFKTKDGLVLHMETHQPRDSRKFVCVDCGRRFAQKQTMQRHYDRKHLNAPPPCACQLCPERFRRTTYLKEHMKKEHGVVMMTRKMFYRALPGMTDEEVQNAVAYRL